MGIDTGTNVAIYSLTHTPFAGMGISTGMGMGNTAGTLGYTPMPMPTQITISIYLSFAFYLRLSYYYC
jgi:hypothetical protein